MRVALETSSILSRSFTGIQRYILELSRALAALEAPDLSCRMLLRLVQWHKRKNGVRLPWPVQWYFPGMGPAPFRCDLVHGLDVRIPRTPLRIRRVGTLHDTFVLTLPDYRSRKSRAHKTSRYRRLVRVADRIITVSESTKSELLKHFDYPAERIDVVYLGVSPALLAPPPAEEGMSEGKPYFLAFGLGSRKNLPRVIEALGRSSLRNDVRLIVVGSMSESSVEAIRSSGMGDAIRPAGPVDDDGLARLYRRSCGLLFPSLFEGFGLPVLEAMASGVPVLTGNRGATAEISKGHAVLVDPESVEEIAAGIERMPGIGDEALAEAASYAREFTWQRTAEKTLAVYRSLVD